MTLGTVEQVDQFLTHHRPPAESWEAYWDFCRKFFREVTGTTWREVKEQNYVSSNTYHFLLDTVQSRATSAILGVYDFLRDEEQLPDLFKRFSSLESPPLKPFLTQKQMLGTSAKHLGQMGFQFPLAPSQREALYHLLESRDGEIIAVNGPPGTGKTTLVQNVVAALFVQKALERGDPPVIVASSNNNQAVTNILDTFGRAKTAPGPLAGRWLPELVGYGMYLPTSAYKITNDPPCVTPFGEGFPKSIESREYYQNAKPFFLRMCGGFAGKEFHGIKPAVDWIHMKLADFCFGIEEGHRIFEKMVGCHKEIKRFDELGGQHAYLGQLESESSTLSQDVIRARELHSALMKIEKGESFWARMFSGRKSARERRAARCKALFSDFPISGVSPDWSDLTSVYRFLDEAIGKLAENLDLTRSKIDHVKQVKGGLEETAAGWNGWKAKHGLKSYPPKLYDELDTSLRHSAFQLAAHYWEGRWLIACQDLLSSETRTDSKKRHEGKWRRYAMLTPCFVSTFYMLPRFFSYPVRSDKGDGFVSLPHLAFIDLLIVDEAGQVTPEIAGASFALAKKAMVVGDIHQIEPVWNIPYSVDAGNLEACGLVDDRNHSERLQEVHNTGLTASMGSVMKAAAHNACHQLKGQDMRGFLLT